MMHTHAQTHTTHTSELLTSLYTLAWCEWPVLQCGYEWFPHLSDSPSYHDLPLPRAEQEELRHSRG